jgi:hypothetical protein
MNWQPHPTSPKWFMCTDYPSIDMYVRVEPLPNQGKTMYIFQVSKYFGWADTFEQAKEEAEELAFLLATN